MTNLCDLYDKYEQHVAQGPKVALGQSPPGPEILHGKQLNNKVYENLHLVCEIQGSLNETNCVV